MEYSSEGSKKTITLEIYEWMEALVPAFIIVAVLLTFVFMRFTVVGTSMLPTLHDGDKLLTYHLFYTPKKGDIITLNAPKLEKNIVKRIIATPGDTIKFDFDAGEVYVNGELLDEPYINTPTNLKADWNYPNTIPDGYIFVMGDNRNNSRDSRSKDVKLVKYEDITGKVILIWYPFNRMKII